MIGASVQFFLLGIVFWIILDKMVLPREWSLFASPQWLRAWWKKVTWDEEMHRPNNYGSTVFNILGTGIAALILILASLAVGALTKIWIRFIFGV